MLSRYSQPSFFTFIKIIKQSHQVSQADPELNLYSHLALNGFDICELSILPICLLNLHLCVCCEGYIFTVCADTCSSLHVKEDMGILLNYSLPFPLETGSFIEPQRESPSHFPVSIPTALELQWHAAVSGFLQEFWRLF